MTTSTGRSTGGRNTKRATGQPPAAKSPAKSATGDVERAVLGDLKRFPADLAASGLALSAVALAREIDRPGNSATSKSMCARSLLDTLDRLRALCPVDVGEDTLDELTRRRATRLGGA